MRPLTSTLVFLALSACGSTWEAADLDGDGYTVADGDCWENEAPAGGLSSADIHPGAQETWYDGFDQDCSGGNDFDKDGDGHASAAFPDPTGALPSDDCWDDPDVVPDDFTAADPSEQVDAAAVFPGAPETWYDGIDQDCGGEDDFDQDGDGFASAAQGVGDDCFDAEDDDFDNDAGLLPEDVNPDVTETWYDGTDADCAGDDDFDQDKDGYVVGIECDDLDPTRYPDPNIDEVWYDGVDDNCDGNDGDQDGDGFYAADYPFEVPAEYTAGDCWDDPALGGAWSPLNGFDPLAPAAVNPAATETWYDGLDQDCNGGGDFDRDGDGFLTDAFSDAGGIRGDDCDDASVAVNPAAPEEWYDGVDQDCAGDDDYDQDHDGFATGEDCDDLAVDVNPGALETCGNTVDEDCSGSDNDDGALGCSAFFADADSDSYGGADEACLCHAEGVYTATLGDDCDDGDDAVNPGATESCLTAADDDCDGSDNAVDALGCTDWYTDADSDGYGTSVKQCACEASGVFRADEAGDCNDASASVRPGATETCNSADDDCDGSTDEGLPLYYADADDDGYGAGTGTCSSSGRVDNDDDCDDASAYVYPDAPELCDGEPNDCTTAASWTEADEDQKVSYVTTGGAWSDVSTSFDDATSTNVQLNSSGTYYFCGGTYYTKLIGNADTVDVVGMYGAESTVLVNNAGSGTTLSVTNGSVSVSGLTLSGGVGSGSSGSTYGGGVIASANPAPASPTLTLEDCIVTDNDAAYGAGVAVYTSAYVSLVRTTVTGNAATINGGGVWVSQNGKLTMTDAEISANTATTGGGGLYVYSTGTATLAGTEISGNSSPGDGGGIFLDDGTLTMSTSTVSGNSATDDGGGLFIDTGVATCSGGGIYDNTAGDEGGGVYLSNHSSSTASFTAASCDFGTGSLDNAPSDVTVKTGGSSYLPYTSYGATASFVCTNASDLCS